MSSHPLPGPPIKIDDNALTTSDKLLTVANYVGASVVSAFFTSLERFSCINLSTVDLDDDDEAKDFPLMFCTRTRHDDPIHALPAPNQPAHDIDDLPV